jgi:hypothetical protein
MNKTLLTTILAGAFATSALAQGQFTFSTPTGGFIKFTTDGIAADAGNVSAVNGQPTISGFGNLNIAVFSDTAGTTLGLNPNGTPNLTGWTQDTFGGTSTFVKIFPSAGGVSPVTIVTGSSASSVEVEVVGWTGTATSFANALTGNGLVGWAGSTLSGGTLGYLQTIAVPPSPTPGTTTVANGGFNGLTLGPATIPEPTTIALGGLGAAALCLFRRRK